MTNRISKLFHVLMNVEQLENTTSFVARNDKNVLYVHRHPCTSNADSSAKFDEYQEQLEDVALNLWIVCEWGDGIDVDEPVKGIFTTFYLAEKRVKEIIGDDVEPTEYEADVYAEWFSLGSHLQIKKVEINEPMG